MKRTDKTIINYSVEKSTKAIIEDLSQRTKRNPGQIIDIWAEEAERKLQQEEHSTTPVEMGILS